MAQSRQIYGVKGADLASKLGAGLTTRATPLAGASATFFCTGGLPAAGTDTATQNGKIQCAEIYIPTSVSVTGIRVLQGLTVGNQTITAAITDMNGKVIPGSGTTSVTTAGAAAYQSLAFTSGAITLGPGSYLIAIIHNGAADTYYAHPTGGFISGEVTQAYGAIANFTPPTTFTTNKGPVATLY